MGYRPKYYTSRKDTRYYTASLHQAALYRNKLVLQYYWYHHPDLLYYWIKILFRRETAFLSPTWTGEYANKRLQRCHNTIQLKESIKYSAIDKYTGFVNLYYSLATFETSFPLFRKDEADKRHDYNAVIWKDFKSYDAVIDIDSPQHDKNSMNIAFHDMQHIHQDLARKKQAHYIRFSGKGFHIFLSPALSSENKEDFNPESKGCIYGRAADIAKEYSEKYSCLIDLGIYDCRRVIKLPYSLVHYPDNSYICAPLDIKEVEEWTDFNLELFEVRNFIKHHEHFPEVIKKDYIFEYP